MAFTVTNRPSHARWAASTTARSVRPPYSPIDSEIVVGRYAQATSEDVDDAVSAAKAFAPEWEAWGWERRRDLMLGAADLMDAELASDIPDPDDKPNERRLLAGGIHRVQVDDVEAGPELPFALAGLFRFFYVRADFERAREQVSSRRPAGPSRRPLRTLLPRRPRGHPQTFGDRRFRL